MIQADNYDITKLSVSVMVGNIFDEEDPPDNEWYSGSGYVNVLDDLHEIRITQKIEHDTVNFSPQAGTADIHIGSSQAYRYFDSLYGRPCMVSYDGATLFLGTLRETSADVTPDLDANKYDVSLTAMSAIYDLSKRHLSAFEAPQESGADRLVRIMDELGLTADVQYAYTGLMTYDSAPILEPYSGDALSLLNELALTHHARLHVRPDNKIVLRDDAPTVALQFDAEDSEKRDFTRVAYGSSDDQHLSDSVAILKRNEKLTHVASKPGAYIKRSENYLVDVSGPTELAVWNLALKLQRFPPFMPTALRTIDVEDVDWENVHCGNSLAEVKLPYRSANITVGIVGITHTFTPKKWTVDLDFCTRYFMEVDGVA